MYTMNTKLSILVKECEMCFKRYCSLQYVSKTQHPYIMIKHTSDGLADQLVRSIIYNNNGLVVLNKPYGISFSDSSPKDKEFEVSLHSLLPHLKDKLRVNKLIPAKVPERYASGVAVFCTDKKLHKRLKTNIASMRALRIPAESYDCIVLGRPNQHAGVHWGGVSLVSSPDGTKKGIQLVQECSKNQVRDGKVKNFLIEHKTLASNELASRLNIKITRTKWHALRLYTASRLVCPLLGDRVFGGLVKNILGKTVVIDMWSPAASQQSKLPKELLTKLDLISRNDIEIPLHLHLSRLTLQNFPSKGKVLEFSADPPQFYNWTCSKLLLEFVDDDDAQSKIRFIS